MKRGILVIVPCGKGKIWDSRPSAGPTAARDAYTGAPFSVNRDFAEKFGEAWVILSAKYGFIEPEFQIPGPYNVTFSRKKTGPRPISTDQLREQVRRRHLDHYATVIGLGGKEYRDAIEDAFGGTTVQLKFPFSGLKQGPTMQATNRAIGANDPLLRLKTSKSEGGQKMLKRFRKGGNNDQRAMQIWQILVGKAHNRQTITYRDLCYLLGFKKPGNAVTNMLERIYRLCDQNKLPPLTILVVNLSKGIPGQGLPIGDRDRKREKVFAKNWYEIHPPSEQDFSAAYKRSRESL
jgi:hypothetical protein